MAPKRGETPQALAFHRQYAELMSQPPYSEATSPYLLHKCCVQGSPKIEVTAAVIKQWWGKYRVVEGQTRITSARELQERYGDSMAHYAVEHPTPFKLCQALAKREHPICIDDSIAKEWLRTYGGQGALVPVNSAGHLELQYGDRIRANLENKTSAELASWCRHA